MDKEPDRGQRASLITNGWVWAVGYVLMLAGIVFGLRQAQQWSSVTYDNEKAVSRWQEFRSDVINQPEDAPVKRRTPKSKTPPANVLLHDYFAVCLTLSIVLCSALYVTFMVMVRGAFASPGSVRVEP